jgi:hypothetical protein
MWTTIIAFVLKNSWARYALEALAAVALICLLLGLIDRHGYDRCNAEVKAQDAATAQAFQIKATDALSAEMMASASLQQSHSSITQTIGANHDKDADAPAPGIIQSGINGLYGNHP